MMKFFRKHQKAILLGMAILMVLFLVPTAFDRGGGSSNPVLGQYRVDGKLIKVYRNDILAAHRELQLLADLCPASALPYAGGNFDRGTGGLAWHLWRQEVSRHEIRVTSAERTAFYRDQRLSNQRVDKVRERYGATIREINDAIDTLIALNKLTTLAESAAMSVSEHDVKRMVRDVREAAEVNLAVADVEAFEELVGPATQPATSPDETATQPDVDPRRQAALQEARKAIDRLEDLVKNKAEKLPDAVAAVNRELAERLPPTTRPADSQPATAPDTQPATQPTTQPERQFVRLHAAVYLRRLEIVPDRQHTMEIFQDLLGEGRDPREALEEARQKANKVIQVAEFPSAEVIDRAFKLTAAAPLTIVDDPQRDLVALMQFVRLIRATDLDYQSPELRRLVQQALMRQTIWPFYARWYDVAGRLKFEKLTEEE